MVFKRDLPRSLATFLSGLTPVNTQLASATAVKPNELEQILVYDVGFCYMMMWNFDQALFYFSKFVEISSCRSLILFIDSQD